MDTSHTNHANLNIPRSPVAARRTSPTRDQPSSPNTHEDNAGSTSPTAAHRTNLTVISETNHATPVLPHGRNRRDLTAQTDQESHPERMRPLLETDALHPLPPLAGSEIDDLEENHGSIPLQSMPGVDDGLLAPSDAHAGIGDPFDGTTEHVEPHGEYDPNKDPEAGFDSSFPDDGFAPNGLSPRLGGDDEPLPPIDPRIIPDVNVYQQKKNLAQGMMDLALLSANANQLRYVWESYDSHPYFYPSVIFISMSLLLQIAVGVGLILNSTYDVKKHDEIHKADRVNDLTVIGIFLITIVNVFVSSFGVGTTSVAQPSVVIPGI